MPFFPSFRIWGLFLPTNMNFLTPGRGFGETWHLPWKRETNSNFLTPFRSVCDLRCSFSRCKVASVGFKDRNIFGFDRFLKVLQGYIEMDWNVIIPVHFDAINQMCKHHPLLWSIGGQHSRMKKRKWKAAWIFPWEMLSRLSAYTLRFHMASYRE